MRAGAASGAPQRAAATPSAPQAAIGTRNAQAGCRWAAKTADTAARLAEPTKWAQLVARIRAPPQRHVTWRQSTAARNAGWQQRAQAKKTGATLRARSGIPFASECDGQARSQLPAKRSSGGAARLLGGRERLRLLLHAARDDAWRARHRAAAAAAHRCVVRAHRAAHNLRELALPHVCPQRASAAEAEQARASARRIRSAHPCVVP